MDKQPHLLVCISAHGYGHLAQTAPVLNALRALLPELSLTVRSPMPLALLRTRIHGPFQYIRDTGDIGMLMSSALDVRAAETAEAYQRLHRDWGLSVTLEAQAIRMIAPDFVLSNVGYLPLAGAFRAGIPCAAMSSLNWGDIFAHYCEAISGTHHIVKQIHLAYANARAFLQLTPGMPMSDLANRIAIGPVTEPGRNRRKEIDAIFTLAGNEKLVLVSMGGIDTHLPLERWPDLPGVRWLVDGKWRNARPDALLLEDLDLPFSDILASCNAMVCKPGYGTFVEAACGAVPLLYVRRGDWPEAEFLTAWLDAHGRGAEITREQMETGQFSEALQTLLAAPAAARVDPTGVAQAAEWLAQQLHG